MILTLRVLSCWLAHVGLRVCSRIIPSFLWPLGFCTEIRVRKPWKIWRCEIVLLCHLWLGLRPEYYVTVPPMMCLFQFIALLHGFKSLPPVPSSSEILIYFCA